MDEPKAGVMVTRKDRPEQYKLHQDIWKIIHRHPVSGAFDVIAAIYVKIIAQITTDCDEALAVFDRAQTELRDSFEADYDCIVREVRGHYDA